MNKIDKKVPVLFGEVLFDCFPDGETVLGGAPFNVAWHLQAFNDHPCFVSRIGKDELGAKIQAAMERWGMSAHALQQDEVHATGRVEIKFEDNEPHYNIMPDSAYDFIGSQSLPESVKPGLLYHGSLALRNAASRGALEYLVADTNLPIFVDVNLRSPWWSKDEVLAWLNQADWVKLNEDELVLLYGQGELLSLMKHCVNENELNYLVVTRGEQGAIALTQGEESIEVKPGSIEHFVDTVGAGDAFTSVLVHGLLNGWALADTMERAQRFASAIVGQRGAIPTDRSFYQQFVN